MDTFNLNSFWQYVSDILRQLDCHHSTDNIGLAELIRADCQSILTAVLGRVAPIAASLAEPDPYGVIPRSLQTGTNQIAALLIIAFLAWVFLLSKRKHCACILTNQCVSARGLHAKQWRTAKGCKSGVKQKSHRLSTATRILGYSSLKDKQKEAIIAFLSGNNVL